MHLPIDMLKKTYWVISVAIIVFLSACSTQQPAPQETAQPFNFKRLLVLPVEDMARAYGENVTVQCRLCGNVLITGKVAEGADVILTDHLEGLLLKKKDFEMIPSSQGQGALSDVLSDDASELPERELLVKVGLALDADAVLAGKVYRFIERDGTNYSVTSPASVGFDMILVRVADGRTMWSGHFDETQRSLFENIYKLNTFVKRGGRWVTAEQLAIEGLNNMFKTFPVQ